MRAFGVDPGLRRTGWGVVEGEGARLSFVACGVITAPTDADLADRLAAIQDGIAALLIDHAPHSVAIEKPFLNMNAESSMKLGMAWGAAAIAGARAGLQVAEYMPRSVKQAVVGSGGAEKGQVAAMVRRLLPASGKASGDAADALAVAICHLHNAQSARAALKVRA